MDNLIDKFSKMNLLNLEEEEEEDEGFFDETEQMCRQEIFTKNINILNKGILFLCNSCFFMW